MPKRIAWISCGVLLWATSARAGEDDKGPAFNPDRPGIADGSTVVGRNRFQVELGLQQEYRNQAGAKDQRFFFPLLLRYGTSDRTELRFEAPGGAFIHARATAPGSAAVEANGYTPLSLGFKVNFQDQPEGSRRPSVGMIVRVFPASGSSAFRSTHLQTDLRFAGDWTFAPHWSLNPNLGIALYQDGNGNNFSAGLGAITLTRELSKRTSVFIDYAVQRPEARGATSSMTYDAGAQYLLNDNTQLDLSAGTGIHGLMPARPFIAVGYSRRF